MASARFRHVRGRTAIVRLAVLGVAGLVLAACGAAPAAQSTSVAAPLVVPAGARIVHPAPPTAASDVCGDPTASIAPPAVLPAPGQMPAGSYMAEIAARGYLRVGVDQSTYLWGYRDPATGELQGFDIDMLHQLSQAIFGSPDRILPVIVANADRQKAVESGLVDVVAETMTINCDRVKQVDFSSVYFQAGQQILVPSDSTITGPQDLGGKRVCATDGSTSLRNLAAPPVPRDVTIWAVANETDCLVMLQQGQVDAISTDNAILEGLAAQDPNTKIVGSTFTQEPYGMAISKAHPDFTSFVNGVLANERADGTWAAIYQRWLGAANPGQPTPAPPVATYRAGT